MAHDMDTKLKIRAFYECNDMSLAKVHLHFESLGYDVSKKTIENWARDASQAMGKWVKNKYASKRDAVEAILPPDVLENVEESMREVIIKALMSEGGEVIEPEIIEESAGAVSRQLIYDTLSKHSLLGKMTANLNRAEKAAATSTSIGVHATYHQMLTSTIQTVYGKKIEMVPEDPNNKVRSDTELEEMSTADLRALMGQ